MYSRIISIKISDSMLESLDREAERLGLSRSELIRYAIYRVLNDRLFPVRGDGGGLVARETSSDRMARASSSLGNGLKEIRRRRISIEL